MPGNHRIKSTGDLVTHLGILEVRSPDGRSFRLMPGPDGTHGISLPDGRKLVLSVDKTLPRQSDWLYVARYVAPDGTVERSGHRFGTYEAMTRGLGIILGNCFDDRKPTEN